ncbi:MAG: recombination protein NinB [Zoogloea oleivorans]|jgi:hypothetical protein|uniref:recombination protein NinB n=1 Tax=Zoogloea oleivorans TaxID=1552750 RepID=UPI002A36B43F|nr:recombination protein NinB [Zoogloea oleivorans]MDY0036705.1 recombination protein NinB [Zoogloea oleivorans]
MSEIYREFVLRGPSVWKALVAFVKANAKAACDARKPLRVIVTSSERKRSAEQNARLWKAVYEQIEQQSWVNGRQYDKDTWHEYLAEKFLPKKEVEMPDGTMRLRRKSTTELTISEFGEYMQAVEAYAASELGVVFYDQG